MITLFFHPETARRVSTLHVLLLLLLMDFHTLGGKKFGETLKVTELPSAGHWACGQAHRPLSADPGPLHSPNAGTVLSQPSLAFALAVLASRKALSPFLPE